MHKVSKEHRERPSFNQWECGSEKKLGCLALKQSRLKKVMYGAQDINQIASDCFRAVPLTIRSYTYLGWFWQQLCLLPMMLMILKPVLQGYTSLLNSDPHIWKVYKFHLNVLQLSQIQHILLNLFHTCSMFIFFPSLLYSHFS